VRSCRGLQGLWRATGLHSGFFGGIGVWQGVAMYSLKFHLGPPCPNLLCPVGGPPLKWPISCFRGGGLQLSFTPLNTPRRMQAQVKLAIRLCHIIMWQSRHTATPQRGHEFIQNHVMIIVRAQLIQLLCGLVTKNFEPENSRS
jgi:hypothetical protein